MKYSIPAPIPAKEGCNVLYRVIKEKSWSKSKAVQCMRDWIVAYYPKMPMSDRNRLRDLIEERWEEFDTRPDVVKFLKDTYNV